MPTVPTRAQPYTTKGEMRALLERASPILRGLQAVFYSSTGSITLSQKFIKRILTDMDPLLDDMKDVLDAELKRPVGRPKGL